MATFATPSNQIATLKELYPEDGHYLQDLVYKKNPFMALVRKNESPDGFAGKYIPVPIVYGAPQGRSATFSNAQGNQTQAFNASFFVYRVKNYELVTIENELLEATKSNAGAFIDAAKLAMDTGFRNIGNDMALDLFGDGSGSRGVISSISTGLITLADPNTVVNFEVGMSLVSYSVAGSTFTQSTLAAIGYVIAVNRSAGTVTVSATVGGAAGTPTNWSTSFPNLGVQGDVAFGTLSATTSFLKMSGLSAWVPLAAPVAGDPAFWGVDRAADPTRLGGVRFDGSSESIEEALIDGASLVAREGGQPEMAFVNFASFAALEKSLGSKVQYVQAEHDEAQIAFKGITVNAPYGPITVIPDRNCPARTAFLLTMETWQLRSLGKAPHVLTYGMEGLEGIRVGTADALEVRIGYYGNLICNAPGWNCRVLLSS
jgi:hypothetical protein